jgi:hypothetical protein
MRTRTSQNGSRRHAMPLNSRSCHYTEQSLQQEIPWRATISKLLNWKAIRLQTPQNLINSRDLRFAPTPRERGTKERTLNENFGIIPPLIPLYHERHRARYRLGWFPRSSSRNHKRSCSSSPIVRRMCGRAQKRLSCVWRLMQNSRTCWRNTLCVCNNG